jgi:hypothetical protein
MELIPVVVAEGDLRIAKPALRRRSTLARWVSLRLMSRVQLIVVGNSLEAENVCGLLRTEGIACDHRQTDVGAGAGDGVGDTGPREILVEPDDLERARELVSA